MNETTLWNVAESQQNINQPTNQTEQPAQQEQPKVEVQPTQSVEQNNLTWNSSWVVEPTQSVQSQQTEQSTPDQQTQDLMSSINEIINEQHWDVIWEGLEDLYPNLKGRVDFAKVCSGILKALPPLEDGVLVSRKDVSRIAESVGNSLIEILIVYDKIYENNGVGETTS